MSEVKETIVKTVRKNYDSKIEAGIAWFKFMMTLNGVHLAPREIELMAFINSRGTISSSSAKEEFVKMFDSSIGTITNMTPRLYDLKLLVKEQGKLKVHPSLRVDFDKEFVVRLYMNTKPEEETNAD